MKTIEELVRPNIRRLRPYASARHEFTGTADIYLDANENPFPTGYNRYPDPYAIKVKQALAAIRQVPVEQMVLGNGSDEIIDLIFRIFCEPGQDMVLTLPPTYGMYRVAADIANVEVVEVPLRPSFQPDVAAVLEAATPQTKVLWLCSPNNPTGNDFSEASVRELVERFHGIVVIDEAYIDFAARESYARWIGIYPNLIVMQTFSKALGLAGIRLGVAMASEQIIGYFNKVKPPYNVNQLTQQVALDTLNQFEEVSNHVATIIGQRALLAQYLGGLPFVERIFPSDANFLLVRVAEPQRLYRYLTEKGIIVRDRSKLPHCEGCLRITVGLPEENEFLFRALVDFAADTSTSMATNF